MTARIVRSAAAVALGAALCGPARAAGQADTARSAPPVLTGVVVDAATGAPLRDVLVRVLDGRRSATDGDGRFTLDPGEPAPWPVLFEQLGYRSRLLELREADAAAPLRIALDPDPILLEGLQVTVDRFQRRRRAWAGPVRALDAERLLRAPGPDALAVLRYNVAGLRECWPRGGVPGLCYRRRGREFRSKVCIDDRRAWDPAGELSLYAPDELYLMEVYDGGGIVLIYTRQFMAMRTKDRRVSNFPPPYVC